jgi:hypothetical protein
MRLSVDIVTWTEDDEDDDDDKWNDLISALLFFINFFFLCGREVRRNGVEPTLAVAIPYKYNPPTCYYFFAWCIFKFNSTHHIHNTINLNSQSGSNVRLGMGLSESFITQQLTKPIAFQINESQFTITFTDFES